MAARLHNLVPRWGQDGAKMTQDGALSGHLEGDWGVILSILGKFGTIFAEMAEV